MITDDASTGFEAPGPGSWTLDTARFPRPATRFVMELFPLAARRGFQEATSRYGLLLDHIQWAFVARWAYLSPRPVAALRQHMPATRGQWDELVEASPALRQRLAISAEVFDARAWREEVRRWDADTKPALRRGHLALQAVDPGGLDDHGLAAHVADCRDNLDRAIHQHHRLNVAPVLPAGDLLARAAEWTGRDPAHLLPLLAGGQGAAGAASELQPLVNALRDDAPARERLADIVDPEEALAALTDRPGPVRSAAAECLAVVGQWSVGAGTDVSESRLAEMPAVLVRTLRAALDGSSPSADADGHAAAPLAADVRAEVPSGHRDEFDRLLAEARATHRVREERSIHCDVWAMGLARRAILTGGERLADAGVLSRAEHLLEADFAEMGSLIRCRAGPSSDELAARAAYREQASQARPPAVLGGPVGSPVPVGWLPVAVARTERAFRTYVAAMSGQAPPADAPSDAAHRADAPSGQAPPATASSPEGSTGGHPATVQGRAASPGRRRGRARVVHGPDELAAVEPGDVLVTAAMTPGLQVVLPLLGAVVTDQGGPLSHAAISAREQGIPAVVGTATGTGDIPDGAMVEVDGSAGEVRLVR